VSRGRAIDDWGRVRLAQALESLDDAITLLEWRYSFEAESSIARLERIREELRMALALARDPRTPLH
jgi:hypothetical protein